MGGTAQTSLLVPRSIEKEVRLHCFTTLFTFDCAAAGGYFPKMGAQINVVDPDD